MKPNTSTLCKMAFAVFYFTANDVVQAQTFNGLGSECQSLGNIRFGQTNAWSAHNCMTDMHTDTFLHIGASISRPYLTTELQDASLATVFNHKRQAFGGYLHYLGYSISHDISYGMGVSTILNEKVRLGIKMQRSVSQIESKNLQSRHVVSVGLRQTIHQHLALYYLVEKSIANLKTHYDVNTYATGVVYSANAQVDWLNQVIVRQYQGLSIHSGIKYLPKKQLALRCGFQTNPALLSFGFALNLPTTTIILAFSNHRIMGITPSLSIQWQSN